MKSRPLRPLLELAVCATGFALAVTTYESLDPLFFLTPESRVSLGLASGIFWIATRLYDPNIDRSAWVISIEQTLVGTGLNLILQAVLSYAYVLDPIPLPMVLMGSALSGVMIGSIRAIPRFAGAQSRVLMVGSDPIGEALVASLGVSVIGMVEADSSRVPPGMVFLGGFSQLAEVVAAQRPSRIVVSLRDWASRVSPRVLLNARLAGVAVEEAGAVYERLFLRLCAEGVKPADLLVSPAFSGSRAIMAVQAVYSNLLGLILLVGLSPVLIALGAIARAAAGAGPFFDEAECAGFQNIPFFRMRFRTRRAKTGEMTWIGRAILRLGLVNLPQFLNVVRGEMGLFGPAPVRSELAARLRELIPFYAHRFTMKPGLLGWAQTHRRLVQGIPEETVQLEYDLYYIKESSPSLDLEILLRRLLGVRHASAGKGS